MAIQNSAKTLIKKGVNMAMFLVEVTTDLVGGGTYELEHGLPITPDCCLVIGATPTSGPGQENFMYVQYTGNIGNGDAKIDADNQKVKLYCHKADSTYRNYVVVGRFHSIMK